MSAAPPAVAYHVPRARRRLPVVLTGVLGLSGLLLAQLAVAGGMPGGAPERPSALVAGPTTAVSPDPGPAAGPLPQVTAVTGPAPRLTPAPETTVGFQAGAVLDAQAVADLGPALQVLTAPDAAPVLLTGTARPGVDEASSLRLAQERADAVATVLVEAGVPAALLSTAAVVAPDAGRSVVLGPTLP